MNTFDRVFSLLWNLHLFRNVHIVYKNLAVILLYKFANTF